MEKERMIWDREHLLNGNRFRQSIGKSKVDGRNDFESDYSRIVFSAPFRRLQDKAQVFPLDKSDYIRTRLTHSLEVAAIAKSIGISVESELIKKGYLDESYKGQISAILESAGLAHDMGNPPFGHFGETTIQEFFKEWFKNNKTGLTDEQKADFTNFDGNTQTLRLLTKLQYLKDMNGMNLTYATLATLIKYPRSSVEGNKKIKDRVSYKKFGYFQSEKKRFEEIIKQTGLFINGEIYRHPLTILLEAADDIAYSAADIEDGWKKNVISYKIISEILKANLDDTNEDEKKLLENFVKFYDEIDEKYPDKEEIAIQKFRIHVQGFMIEAVVESFIELQDAILAGEFDDEILKVSKAKNLRKAFETLARTYIFNDKNILKRELAGEKIICRLLECFVDAITNEYINDEGKPVCKYTKNSKESKIYKLISNNYRFIYENIEIEETNDLYNRLLLVTDFICGMTDSYALDLYQKLSGVSI